MECALTLLERLEKDKVLLLTNEISCVSLYTSENSLSVTDVGPSRHYDMNDVKVSP